MLKQMLEDSHSSSAVSTRQQLTVSDANACESNISEHVGGEVPQILATQSKRTELLSKYMDDKIRNFNPRALRPKIKRSSSSATCDTVKKGTKTSVKTCSTSSSSSSNKSNLLKEQVAASEDTSSVPVAPAVSGTAKDPSVRHSCLAASSTAKTSSPGQSAHAIASSVEPTAIAAANIAPAGITCAATAAAECEPVHSKRKRVSFIANLLHDESKVPKPQSSSYSNSQSGTQPSYQAVATAAAIDEEQPPVKRPTRYSAETAKLIAASESASINNHTGTSTHEKSSQLSINIGTVGSAENATFDRQVSKGHGVQQSSASSGCSGSSGSREVVAAAAIPKGGGGFSNILEDPARNIMLNGRCYTRLNVLGKGGSSCVYRIISQQDGEVYAYKRVEVRDSEDAEMVLDNYANEIALLRRLRDSSTRLEPGNNSSSSYSSSYSSSSSSRSISAGTSRIIELVDFEVNREERFVAMLLEPGDIDLSRVLSQKHAQRNKLLAAAAASNSAGGLTGGSVGSNSSAGIDSSSGSDGCQRLSQLQLQQQLQQQYLDPFFARMVWREMLEAVNHIHEHRIVHGKLVQTAYLLNIVLHVSACQD